MARHGLLQLGRVAWWVSSSSFRPLGQKGKGERERERERRRERGSESKVPAAEGGGAPPEFLALWQRLPRRGHEEDGESSGRTTMVWRSYSGSMMAVVQGAGEMGPSADREKRSRAKGGKRQRRAWGNGRRRP